MVQGGVWTPRAGSRGGLGGSASVDLGPVAGVTGVGRSDSPAESGKVDPPKAGDIETAPLRPRRSGGSAHVGFAEVAAPVRACGGFYLTPVGRNPSLLFLGSALWGSSHNCGRRA